MIVYNPSTYLEALAYLAAKGVGMNRIYRSKDCHTKQFAYHGIGSTVVPEYRSGFT